jgi:transposase-like protein
VFVSINGRHLYVWRAVDNEGEVLDILVQPRRDRKAALKLMRKLLKKQGITPATDVTDKLGSYSSALRELSVARRHDAGRWKNNRAENSHQPLPSDLPPNPARVSRSGYADMAPRDSRSVNRLRPWSFGLQISDLT